MAGIDGITGDILAAARNEAGELIQQAETAAAAVREKAQAEASQLFDKLIAQAREKAEAQTERAASQAQLKKRQTLLFEKQQIISEVIEKAKASLAAQDGAAYFAMTAKLIEKNARPQAGEIAFGAADLARLDASAKAAIEAAAKKAGGSLKIAEDAADIKSGFILRYGGIEENCSLDALFAEKADQLVDKVNRALW